MPEKYLDKVSSSKVSVEAEPEKDLTVVLPYLGELSHQICPSINGLMKNKLPHNNLHIAF